MFLKYYTHFCKVKPRGKQTNMRWFTYYICFYHRHLHGQHNTTTGHPPASTHIWTPSFAENRYKEPFPCTKDGQCVKFTIPLLPTLRCVNPWTPLYEFLHAFTS
jgi:hypothetical protein